MPDAPPPPADIEIVVPVSSGEEDMLLGETLHQFAQSMEHDPENAGTLMIVRSEYCESGLVKKVIFEAPAPAARFRTLWDRAKLRLHG